MNPGQTAIGNESTKGSTARVLIVDDEPEGAKTLGMLFARCGYSVEVVTDSTQCLAQVESFQPDVVLLDIAMPRISGYALARQIRSEQKFDRVAVIALSGYCDYEHRELSLEAGCDQHLVKPIRLAAVETVIGHEVEKRRQQVSKHGQ